MVYFCFPVLCVWVFVLLYFFWSFVLLYFFVFFSFFVTVFTMFSVTGGTSHCFASTQIYSGLEGSVVLENPTFLCG